MLDKKTIMQTMVDGYIEMCVKCNYDIKNRLSRIGELFGERKKYIERSQQFWDDISDERITREQEKYLECQRKLAEIVDLMENLESYIKEEDD
jgi:hypothetical protein